MGKQITEMLKGTLEGIVLAILSGRPAYGYEITGWLREVVTRTSLLDRVGELVGQQRPPGRGCGWYSSRAKVI